MKPSPHSAGQRCPAPTKLSVKHGLGFNFTLFGNPASLTIFLHILVVAGGLHDQSSFKRGDLFRKLKTAPCYHRLIVQAEMPSPRCGRKVFSKNCCGENVMRSPTCKATSCKVAILGIDQAHTNTSASSSFLAVCTKWLYQSCGPLGCPGRTRPRQY